MKLATLNLQHGCKKSAFADMVSYLTSLRADILVLTEFKRKENADFFISELGERGYIHYASATEDRSVNSVAIFSKSPFAAESFPELGIDTPRLIKAKFNDFELFGAYFALKNLQVPLFDFLLEGKHRPGAEDYFMTGDFNSGVHGPDGNLRPFCRSDMFENLLNNDLRDAWRSRNPHTEEFSWYSNNGVGFRLDHLLASPSANERVGSIRYDHHPRTAKLTDHSALIADID